MLNYSKHFILTQIFQYLFFLFLFIFFFCCKSRGDCFNSNQICVKSICTFFESDFNYMVNICMYFMRYLCIKVAFCQQVTQKITTQPRITLHGACQRTEERSCGIADLHNRTGFVPILVSCYILWILGGSDSFHSKPRHVHPNSRTALQDRCAIHCASPRTHTHA